MPKLTALDRHAEHACGGLGVEILPASECRDEPFVSRKVREETQLDLRVVGAQEHAVFRCDERRADAAPELGAHGDVLQVGVRARQPARRGNRLVEARVNPAVVDVDELRQGIEVGRLELGQLAVLDDLGGDGMVVFELLEDFLVGRPAVLVLLGLARIEPQHVEQDVPELLGRVDV